MTTMNTEPGEREEAPEAGSSIEATMRELEIRLHGHAENAIDKAVELGATRMRERCLEAIKGLWTTRKGNDYNSALNHAIERVESLTLDTENQS